MTTLTVEHVARIEGHGTISVDVEAGVVRDIRMDIVEPARLFESMVVGRRYDEAPIITSRICGICSPNHAVTTVKAVEAALGVVVSERTTLLRQLMVYGSFLQNHATHLYLFAAPDYVGLPSVFPLARTHPDVVARALLIKKLGNELTSMVGGRSVHPVTAVIGGFTAEPPKAELEAFAARLHAAADAAAETVELFAGFGTPEFETSGEMLALTSGDTYAIYDGDVCALDAGWCKPVEQYREFITEQVVGHSNAKHATVDGRTFLVGALARLNLSWDRLLPTARVVASRAGIRPVNRNSFMNNLCQAIELVDAAERCALLCERLVDEGGSSQPVGYELRAGVGTAATEAPRGTLYHTVSLDASGVVTAGNVSTPTAQNLANLEADMRAFAPTVAGLPEAEFVLSIEQLVRAYDPCLSCAVH
ncbi:MAG TPA: Ni/Fe hydrogenase subunit alpha [Coriobacteriia bacterium]|nr:Ni/Fe hydrogenase subunit alpha [Coriobacteriia bacterium]